MRLTQVQRSVIKRAFSDAFAYGDTLWLFGSRVDDTKRGGDIDLYIETNELDSSVISKRKLAFLGALQKRLGEQKIDVVIKNPATKEALIHQQAQETGIKLMQKQSLLESYIAVLDIHAKRLSWALNKTRGLLPISALTLEDLPPEDVAFLEQVNSRFCKMQDEIGSKVFPEILTMTDMVALSAIDKINAIEKLGFIEDASWWSVLRDVRNVVTHEYENDYPALADNINDLVAYAQQLLEYWERLRSQLETFVAEQKNPVLR